MNLVVGDYLEVAQGFDAVCLIKESFKGLTEKFPSILKTVQDYHKTYGDKVFDLGKQENNTRVIYVPLHNMESVKKACEELQALSAKKGYKNILMPMPNNYQEIKEMLDDMLDSKFTVITDNPDYIQPIEVKEEAIVEKKVLECSSKGDKRYSAMYAKVSYMGIIDTIENHYQKAKRFLIDGQYVPVTSPKGKKVDAIEVFGTLYEASMCTSFYKWLWVIYFRENPNLLLYAKGFDEFNDMFKGKSMNCQADVIRELVEDFDGVVASISFMDDMQKNWKAVCPDVEEPFEPDSCVEDTIEIPKPVTVIVTGHRPNRLWGYNQSAQYHSLQNKLYQCILQFANNYGATRFISGGAQGVDQLFFWSVNHARSLNKEIENVVYIPFDGQEMKWSAQGMFSQTEYQSMLQFATSTHVCNTEISCESPYQQIAKGLMDRNSAMLDEADYVLGVFLDDPSLIMGDGGKGGTLDCLRKAYKLGKKIVLINPMTLQTMRINF